MSFWSLSEVELLFSRFCNSSSVSCACAISCGLIMLADLRGWFESTELTLEKTSATLFSSPGTYSMSVLNCAIKPSWRSWRGDAFSECCLNAEVSGLWSVLRISL